MQQQNYDRHRTERNSSIELLKIFAIFIIVISHVVQTLTSKNLHISNQGYVLDISEATTNLQYIVLLMFRHFGVWGNSLFFICSAWFLLKATAYKKKKWFFMLVEIWTVSIIILIVTYVILHGEISGKIIIKSIFPTLFANNWYMTGYLLFYPISPILNGIIDKMSKKQLFRSTSILSLLYIFLNFIKHWFFPSTLILWLTIYFVVAYMQKYLMRFADNIKKNIVLALVNALCLAGLIILTETGGLHNISIFPGKMLHWAKNCNPFIIFMSIAMFNIARNVHFKNRFINYISSLSLLIYVIHENIILRNYFRPAMWNYVYTNYGYDHLIGWVFILVIFTFLFGIVAAALYSATIQRFVKKISNRLYELLKMKYLFFNGKENFREILNSLVNRKELKWYQRLVSSLSM